ncbi:MAG: (2Fe-2S)-binding protein [Clostridium sp.]
MSNDKVVCLCKNISEGIIIEAIKNGATSLAEVKEETGAATGGCRGARCSARIAELIEENK